MNGSGELLGRPRDLWWEPLLVAPASTPAARIAAISFPYEAPLSLLAVAEPPSPAGDPYQGYGEVRIVPLLWRSSAAWLSPDLALGPLFRGSTGEEGDGWPSGYFTRDERGLVVVREAGGGALLLEAGQAPGRASTIEEAGRILANKLKERPAIGEVLLLPGAGWAAQALVTLCAAAHAAGGERVCSITPEVPAGFLARLSPEPPRDRPRFAAEADRDPDRSLGCYPALRREGADYAGILPFALEIDEVGRVVSAERIASSGAHPEGCLRLKRLQDPALETCLSERLRQVRFSPPAGGRASVQYVFSLSSRE